MAASDEIVRLLGQLRRASSPVERVKLLARGWKGLRKLDRSQIRMLASQLGFEGAEELLTRLARGRGIDVGRTIRALRRAKDADPREIKQFVTSLRERERRGELLRSGAELVADHLDPEIDEPAASETRAATDEMPTAAKPPDRPAPVAASPAAVGGAVVSPAVPHDATRTTAPVVKARPQTPKRVPQAKTRAAAAEPQLEPGGAGALIRSVRDEGNPILRFRRFREGLDALVAQDVEKIRELLACFPAGWQRRRALAALLRRRIPADLHRAIYLIERLDDPAAERWCASTLLDAWDLSADEREAIAARHRLRLHRRTGDPDAIRPVRGEA